MKTERNKVSMETERNKAILILEALDDILDNNDITVPCDDGDEKDREYNDGSAKLYGASYYELEDSITDIISNDGTAEDILDDIKEQLAGYDVTLLEDDEDACNTLAEKIAEVIRA